MPVLPGDDEVLAIVPERDVCVRGLTTDVPRVRRAAQEGYAAVTAALCRVRSEP